MAERPGGAEDGSRGAMKTLSDGLKDSQTLKEALKTPQTQKKKRLVKQGLLYLEEELVLFMYI